MKIKTKLYLGAAIPIGLAIILALVLFHFSTEARSELEKAELADELAKGATELHIVTTEYLAYHEARMEQQWRSKFDSMMELIEKEEESVLLAIMRTSYESLNNSFSQLKTNYMQREELLRTNASQEEIDRTIILEERLAAQMRLNSQKISADAFRMSKQARQEANTIQQRADSMAVILVIALVLTIGTSMFLVTNSITKPIKELVRGANIVRTGNLKHRIDIKSRDETGYLSQAFNQMVEQLNQHREHLEELVKERTSELEEKTVELDQANIRLQEADRHKSQFLANMSHELRTPLNSIIGYTKLMLDGLEGDINEEQRKDLHTVYTSSKHLLELINDLLDLAKIEAGKIVLSCGTFTISELLAEVIPGIKQLAREKGLALTSSVAPTINYLYADKAKTKQVLINILGNAVKFTNEGSIKLNVAESDSDFIFSVTDTGMGIKEEDLEAVFDGFKQVGPAQIAGYEGTGLGLAISKQFVEMQSGRIWAESELGKGSTFTFTLPKKSA